MPFTRVAIVVPVAVVDDGTAVVPGATAVVALDELPPVVENAPVVASPVVAPAVEEDVDVEELSERWNISSNRPSFHPTTRTMATTTVCNCELLYGTV